MTEEDLLMHSIGKENHFRVPEGFFDDFSNIIMKRIEENDDNRTETFTAEKTPVNKPTIFRRLLPYSVAAAIVGVLFGAALYFIPSQNDDTTQSAQVQTASLYNNGDALDQMTEYAMLDNEDLYSYMSSNEY